MNKVLLTIDTEGPRGTDPILYQVWGKVDENQYYGIPKIIDICDKNHVKGLFFVDLPEIWDFGYDKVEEVIKYIRNHGHDVGVHIHPHHMPNEKRQFLFEFSKDEQRKIIQECTEQYKKITGEMPISFRAGKYGANRDTLDILNELGYQYDFSEFYSKTWCGIKPEVAYVLPQKYKSIVEFPVTIFKSLNLGKLYQRYDKLDATIYPSELKLVLDQYSAKKEDGVIILFLHSFSLINFLDTPDTPTKNQKNIKRFEAALKYINESSNLEFIEEADLKKIKIREKDKLENIIETKGKWKQFLFTYIRAYGIAKTNKAARLLIVCTYGLGLLLVFIVVGFLFWRI